MVGEIKLSNYFFFKMKTVEKRKFTQTRKGCLLYFFFEDFSWNSKTVDASRTFLLQPESRRPSHRTGVRLGSRVTLLFWIYTNFYFFLKIW